MDKLLIAEDDPMIARMLELRLQIAGFETRTVVNGHQAVKEAFSDNYDLILMDMHMPEMDGHEATRQLRSSGYQGLIIAVTASALSKDCEKAIQSGCDLHIPKPIGPDFEQQLKDILASQKPVTGK